MQNNVHLRYSSKDNVLFSYIFPSTDNIDFKPTFGVILV